MNPDEKAALESQTGTAATEATRLPCRGCLPDCKNYDSCNGTPWRAEPGASDD